MRRLSFCADSFSSAAGNLKAILDYISKPSKYIVSFDEYVEEKSVFMFILHFFFVALV
jgi:hypothetical protein